MLSEDFALAGTAKRDWLDWYNEEIVNNEMYKTLLLSYKGEFFQFEPVGYEAGKTIGKTKIGEDSYIFIKKKKNGDCWRDVSAPICYDSFKEAIDKAEIESGKTLKDIWDDPKSEYIDFL